MTTASRVPSSSKTAIIRFGTNGTGHQALVNDIGRLLFYFRKSCGSSPMLKPLSSPLATSLVVAPTQRSSEPLTPGLGSLNPKQLRQASLRSTLNEASATRPVPIERTTLPMTTTFEPSPTNSSLAPGRTTSVQVAPRVDISLPPPKDSDAVSVHSVCSQLVSPNDATR